MGKNKNFDALSVSVILVFVVLDIVVWRQILFFSPPVYPRLDFLDVGQGDSTLLTFPGGTQVLTDAGPSRQVVSSLERSIGNDRYIDLAVITHAQLDHYNGFNYLLQNYKVGAFLWNGREAENEEWKILRSKIAEKKIPLILVGEGDSVRYGENKIEIISPDTSYVQSAEPNDTGIVEYIKTPQFSALLTADTGFGVEDHLVNRFNIHADVLKVGHHGSKYSSGETFLKEVGPRVAVIQVGTGNHYGHPAKETVERLRSMEIAVFRNDKNGSVAITGTGDKLKVFTER